MEETFHTKTSPYSVMNYNMLLMNLIHYIFYNMQGGGTGIKQAHNLRAALKPIYQDELKGTFETLTKEYNTQVNKLSAQTKVTALQSDRIKLQRQMNNIQEEFAREVVTEVIAVLDKHGALEYTQAVLQGGKGFQSIMGLPEG